MKRDNIVFALLIAVGGTATGFALAFLMKFGVKAEQLFALIGAIIGAAGTIAGTAWLADRSRVSDQNAEVSMLALEYTKLQKWTSAAQAIEPGYGMPFPADYRTRLLKLAEFAGDVHVIGAEALAHGKALSFLHRAAVRRMQFVISEYLQFWTTANAEVEDLTDDRTYQQMTASLFHECEITLALFDGRTPFAAV